jgi:polysaccharide biosynthesis/export protein
MLRHPFALKTYIPAITILIMIVFSACTSTKEMEYFQDLPNTTVAKLTALPDDQRVIANGDELNVVFIAKDDAAAAYFNKTALTSAVTNEGENLSRTSSFNSNSGSGLNYVVDPNGYVEFPQIGKVRALGMTSGQLKEALTKMVSDKLKDPIVEVRFNTFRISVIGDVRNPGTYTLPMQKPTLLEALAAAGDLAPTAKRYDVQLYRDYKGERKITRIDLRKQDVLNNPDVFLMKHNDVLIVKPAINTIARENVNRFTAITGLAIGIVTLALTIANN